MEAREQLRLTGLRNVLFAEDTLGVESGVFGGAARHLLSRGLCAVVRLHLGIGAQSPHSPTRGNENNTPGVTVTSQDGQDGTLPNTERRHSSTPARIEAPSQAYQYPPKRLPGTWRHLGFQKRRSEAGVRHGALSESSLYIRRRLIGGTLM